MKNDSVKIITCGGTFEKVYDPITGNLIFEKSHVPELIKKSRITRETTFENLMMIDSLDMTEQHRKLIATNIRDSIEKKILIIHGTDTMIETGKAIAALSKPNQTIVLTGAMIPISMNKSDAFFNFGYSLAVIELLNPGVWIAMTGKVFQYNKVKKNLKLGIFEQQVTCQYKS